MKLDLKCSICGDPLSEDYKGRICTPCLIKGMATFSPASQRSKPQGAGRTVGDAGARNATWDEKRAFEDNEKFLRLQPVFILIALVAFLVLQVLRER